MKIQKQSFMDQKIIQSEELFRVQGSKAQDFLHRSIGALSFLTKNKQVGYGSGVLISKNIVLTAAHNVYDKFLNSENTDFKIYLGINGVAKDYYEVEDMRYMQEYKSCLPNEKTNYDFALLKLKKQVTFNNGYISKIVNLFKTSQKQFLQLSFACQKCIMKNNKQAILSIFGFPCKYEKNYKPRDQFGSQFNLYQYGLARSNRVIAFDVQKSKICYGISTLGGQSGCPVVIGKRIIAIHVGAGKKDQQFNVGRFFDFHLFAKLQKWCEQLKGDSFSICDKDLCSHLQQTLKEYLKNKKETILNCSGKNLKQLNVNQYFNLTQLNLQNNQLSAIEVTKNTNLTRLSLNNNQLSAIDVTKNTNLTWLSLSNNQLSAIEVTKNTNLTRLSLNNNQLSAIDVTKNTNLNYLRLNNNQLSAIDVTKNTKLTELSLSNNQLSAIDVTKNTKLTELSLSNNQLSAIDVTQNTNLTWLFLQNNQLSAIDVTKIPNLARLWLQNNKFISISLSVSASKPLQDYLDDYYFDFSDQSSNVCKIQLQYNSAEKSKCNELKDKWAKKYLNQYYNKHGCKYVFTAVEK